MTLKLNRVRVVVKVHVHAKYHRAKCIGSWVIVHTQKKTRTNTIQSVATARTVIK